MPPPNQGPTLSGSFRIFQVWGVSVYMHWSWFVVALIAFQLRGNTYTSAVWNVAEYLALFVIVLLHEFGHTFACRQVGGRADEIVLWPLGGIAFVEPPPRPGALLWSIAAGPLVNVVLVPFTIGAYLFVLTQDANAIDSDVAQFVEAVAGMNVGLLIFNVLPIYPLDGGQILQALLWFVIGRAKSLLVACVIGMIGAGGFVLWALNAQSIWLGVIAAFAAYRCWIGFQQSRLLAQIEIAPRHRDAECPSCDAHPLQGPFWQCDSCNAMFDTFITQGECPNCGERMEDTNCLDCGRTHPIWAWFSLTPRPRYREDDRD